MRRLRFDLNTIALLRKRLVQFLKSEDGPTAVEYATMLGLVIMVCILAIAVIGRNVSSDFSNPSLQSAAQPGSS